MRSLAVKVKMEILKLALKLLSKFYQLLRTFLSHVRIYIYIVMKELFEDNVRRTTVGVHGWGEVSKFHEGNMVSNP